MPQSDYAAGVVVVAFGSGSGGLSPAFHLLLLTSYLSPPTSPLPLLPTARSYYDAAKSYALQYTTLASGWPSDQTVDQALKVFSDHHKVWPSFDVPTDVATTIRRQLPEAPPGLFLPTLVPTLNVVCPAYIAWLDSEAGKVFCKGAIGIARSIKPQKPVAMGSTEDYLDGW